MSEIRIQDDLFEYVNHDWLETAVIPDDKPRVGGFSDLDEQVEKLLISEFNEMCEKNNYPNNYLKYACELYKNVLDVKKKKHFGIKPVLKDLNKLIKLVNLKKFNSKLAELIVEGMQLPFVLSVQEDMKDAVHNALYIQGPSTILPDTTYYKEEMKDQHDALIGMWSNMASELLKHTKLDEADQAKYLADAINFDAKVATLVKSSEEWSEYTKAYNPMKTSKVASLLKPVKFKKVLASLYEEVPERIIVSDVRFLKGFNTLFNEETYEQYLHWAYVNHLISSTKYLSEEYREIGSRYSNALRGISVVQPLEKFAYNVAGRIYSAPIGLYYGEKYFGEEAKKDVVDMVKDIINTYIKRVKNNNILEDATKEKAVLKLSTMKVKMGYPDKVEAIYEKLTFNFDDSLYDIVKGLNKIYTLDNINELYKDVDKTKWPMPGHMVNACYNPTANDITFPAAILQAPFYSIKQSRSQNLGGIGAVIGHEISHAFDNNGALIDELGNINNWWTKADFKRFNKATVAMIKEFDGIELPWGKVNGKFIVSENIADNGGMAVTLDIMSNLEGADYAEYFKNWARVWCVKARPEFSKLLLSIDVHAPQILRANMQPRNFEEWYKTFNVKETDKMYIAPKNRVIIW